MDDNKITYAAEYAAGLFSKMEDDTQDIILAWLQCLLTEQSPYPAAQNLAD